MKHPDFKHFFLLASGLFTGPPFVDGLGLGWGCLRSLELANAMDVTLMMGWGWGWGGDVYVRWNLQTPWMLRWSWGGFGVVVGMFTFVGTCTRLMMGWGWGWGGDVYVRWNLQTPWMLRWWWGGFGVGVGMFTFVGTCTRHGCYADDGVRLGLGLGWGSLRSLELANAMDVALMMGWGWGWGGDVHVRWNLHMPWMLRWWWGGVGVGVGLFTSGFTLDPWMPTGLWWRMASLSLSAATVQESQTQSCGSTSKFNSGTGRWEHASSSQRLDVSSQCYEKTWFQFASFLNTKPCKG